MASGGSPKPLVIGEDGADPQPIVRVGNVVNGKGTVTVDPPAISVRSVRGIAILRLPLKPPVRCMMLIVMMMVNSTLTVG